MTVHRRRGRRALPTAFVVILATFAVAETVAALGHLSSASAADEAGNPAILSMLVMGDSYSAGNGAGSYYGAAGCFRSAYNYAREYERKVEAAPYNQRGFVNNVACSGDTTDAFFGTTSGRPRQLNAVNAGYDVIFLTIGGNDLHFGDIARFCLIAFTRDGANCGANLTRAESMVSDGTMYRNISSVLKGIRVKADPQAKIVLLGYPYLEGDPNYRLRSGHFGNTFVDVGKRVRALGDAGDRIQKQIVNELNAGQATQPFVFISVHQLFAGPPVHELYAQKTNPNRWMIQPGIDASRATWQTYYHPNPTGWSREAELLVNDSSVPKHPAASSASSPPAAHCPNVLLGPVVDVTFHFTNRVGMYGILFLNTATYQVDSPPAQHIWALATGNTSLKIYRTQDDSIVCQEVIIRASFLTIAGSSPHGTGTLRDGLSGSLVASGLRVLHAGAFRPRLPVSRDLGEQGQPCSVTNGLASCGNARLPDVEDWFESPQGIYGHIYDVRADFVASNGTKMSSRASASSVIGDITS